jgi:hypothetical protein
MTATATAREQPMPDVQVRIAVAVDSKGNWHAAGWPEADTSAMDIVVDNVDDGEARYWLTATLPVPEAQTVRAEVAEAKE